MSQQTLFQPQLEFNHWNKKSLGMLIKKKGSLPVRWCCETEREISAGRERGLVRTKIYGH